MAGWYPGPTRSNRWPLTRPVGRCAIYCMPVPDTATTLRTAVLRDTDLATWLGVSRTPVREALLRLGESGLVRAAPGRSTVVAEIDLAEVREAHAVVVAMHRLAVAEAVSHLTPAHLDTMRAAN